MLLSVIVPVYNAGNGLKRCIESILSQIADEDEIILVDDGSADNSPTICNEYQEKYRNIKVIHQLNKGALLTRREGMNIAEGEYFIFPDADDFLVDGAIEKIKGAISQFHPDIICYDWDRIDAISGEHTVIKQLPWANAETESILSISYLREGVGRSNTTGVLNAKAINRHMIDWDADYEQFGNRICVSNDLFQCLPILDNAQTVVYIPEALYCYQKTMGSITLSYKPEKINSYIEVLERREHYLKKWNIKEKYINMSRCRTMGAITLMIEAAYERSSKYKTKKEIAKAFDTVCKSSVLKRCFTAVAHEDPSLLTKRIKLVLSNVLFERYRCARFFLWLLATKK